MQVFDMLGCSAYCVAEVFGRVIQEWLRGGSRGIKGSLLPSTRLGSLLASKMCSCYGTLVKLWFPFLDCWNRSTVWYHMPLNSRLMSLPFVYHAYTCTLALP